MQWMLWNHLQHTLGPTVLLVHSKKLSMHMGKLLLTINFMNKASYIFEKNDLVDVLNVDFNN